MRELLLVVAVVISGCSPEPTVAPVAIDCQLAERCNQVVAAASTVLPTGSSRLVITEGRAPLGVFHAEVHACYPGGRYLLADVLGPMELEGELRVSIRGLGWDDPPCR
jgi:hypothetical protein